MNAQVPTFRMVRDLAKAALTAIWIVSAVFIALFVAPTPLDTGQGRDLRPTGTVLAILLLTSGVFFRFRLQWPWIALVGGLVLVEGLILQIIANFSGVDRFSMFNVKWLVAINLYIALPWIGGVATGSGIVRWKGRK